MKSLIIMSCSKTKKNIDIASAIEMYDGQAYRTLKKNLSGNVRILIISAKYGLLRSTDIISWYDQEMTATKAMDLRKQVQEEVMRTTKKKNTERVFLYLGYPYNLVVSNELMRYLKLNFEVQIADGYIGMRLHQLKEWLKVTQ